MRTSCNVSEAGKVEYFLFYFKNVVEAKSKEEARGGALISYLHSKALKFYCTQFTAKGVLTKKAKSYKSVRERFKERFRRKRDA